MAVLDTELEDNPTDAKVARIFQRYRTVEKQTPVCRASVREV